MIAIHLPIDNITDKLEADGFTPGAPLHVSPWAVQCDRQAAEESPCPRCGHLTLAFTPWHCGRVYRAVATCQRCCHELEM